MKAKYKGKHWDYILICYEVHYNSTDKEQVPHLDRISDYFKLSVNVKDLYLYVDTNEDVYAVAKTEFGKQIEVLKLNRNLTTVFGIITGNLMGVSIFSLSSLALSEGRLFLSIN